MDSFRGPNSPDAQTGSVESFMGPQVSHTMTWLECQASRSLILLLQKIPPG